MPADGSVLFCLFVFIDAILVNSEFHECFYFGTKKSVIVIIPFSDYTCLWFTLARALGLKP